MDPNLALTCLLMREILGIMTPCFFFFFFFLIEKICVYSRTELKLLDRCWKSYVILQVSLAFTLGTYLLMVFLPILPPYRIS